MKTITQEELKKLIAKTKSVLLTSNDLAPRTIYPYYYGHPSAPDELTIFKTIITEYRSVSSEHIHKLGKQQMGQVTVDFSTMNIQHLLLGGIVSASFGWGDCGECVSKLASEIILADCGDLLFVILDLPNAQHGMEKTHFLLVTNMKKPPTLPKETTLEALLAHLPDDAIVADPFLGLCFSPKDIPNELKHYIKAYGNQAQVTEAIHMFNFTRNVLIDSFLPLAKKIVIDTRAAMKNVYSLEGKTRVENQEYTLLVKKLSHKTGLVFQVYQDKSKKTDMVALIQNKTDRQASIEVIAKFADFPTIALEQTVEGKPLLVIRNVHEAQCIHILKKIIGVEQVALINVDFKWQHNQVIALEIDDAINRSGFNGYNALYTGHSGDEAMLRKMIQCLKSYYQRVHFILNNLEESYWPRSQVQEVIYYENIYDFIVHAKQNSSRIENDILIYGDNPEKSSYISVRTANEIQDWLLKEGLYIPVINASSMIDSASNKFIFSQVMNKGVPLTKLIDIKNLKKDVLAVIKDFSDKVLLKLHNSSKGNGILMLTKDELLQLSEALEQYLVQHSKKIPQLLTHQLGEYRSTKLEELFGGCRKNSQILLQDYVASESLEKNGKYYDPTGRVVLLLRKTQYGEQFLEIVDGYWKLPKRPIDPTHFTEEACLSCVEGGTHTTLGAAKLTAAQLSSIKKAFASSIAEWMNLLNNKIDFYLGRINSVPQLEQAFLTKYFTRQIFDKVIISHIHQFLRLTQIILGLDSLLVRTLNSELTSFLSLSYLQIPTPFLQEVLLHYLASPLCLIDFSKIEYSGSQEKNALLINLKNFCSLIPNGSIKLDAQSLLEKLEAAEKKVQCKNKWQADQDNKIAINLYQREEWQAALTLFEKILIANKNLFKDKPHLHVASAHWSISSCYLKLSQPQKAKPHVKQAYDIRKILLGEGNDLTIKTKKRLDDLPSDMSNSMFKMRPPSPAHNQPMEGETTLLETHKPG